MNTQTKYYIIGAVVIIIVLVGGFAFMRSNTTKQADTMDKESVFEEPSEDIPPVDSSVIATIKGKTDALITIENIPEGTESIEYELSYNTAAGSIEGVFGNIEVTGDTAEEEITFGTCSSGVCRYHDIEGAISGTFIFSGSYGEQMLEQEFEL